MKYQIITVALLAVAIMFYFLGAAGLGTAALILGIVFEAWFWVRFIVGKRPSSDTHSSSAKSP